MPDIYSDLVDNIISDESPSEITDNIQNILYAKIGEKIEGMEQSVAQSLFDDDGVVEESVDISETPWRVSDENGKQIGKEHKNARSARRSRDKKDDEVGGYRHRVDWVPDPKNPSLTKSADMDREHEARKKRYATELP